MHSVSAVDAGSSRGMASAVSHGSTRTPSATSATFCRCGVSRRFIARSPSRPLRPEHQRRRPPRRRCTSSGRPVSVDDTVRWRISASATPTTTPPTNAPGMLVEPADQRRAQRLDEDGAEGVRRDHADRRLDQQRGDGAEHGGQSPREHRHPRQADAEEAHRLLVLGRGAHRQPEVGEAQEGGQRRRRSRATTTSDRICVGVTITSNTRTPTPEIGGSSSRGRRAEELQLERDQQRQQRDRRDRDRELRRVPQRPHREPLERQADRDRDGASAASAPTRYGWSRLDDDARGRRTGRTCRARPGRS